MRAEVVERELRALAVRLQRPVRKADVAARPLLFASMRAHFGTLLAAKRAAGLPDAITSAPRHWTRARVIKEIRRLGRRRISGYLWRVAKRFFGSATAARRAAGLPPRRREWSRETPEALLAELRDVLHRGEPVPSGLYIHCAKTFGSFPRARELAGVPRSYEVWSKAIVIRHVRELAGRTAPLRLRAAARKYFGSLRAAYLAARVEPKHSRWTRAHVIAAFRELGERKAPRALAYASRKLFGSVEAARRQAGVPSKRRRWSRPELLAALRRAGGVAHGSLRLACCRHFGSVRAARLAASLPERNEVWSRERVLSELRVIGSRAARKKLQQACIRYFGSVTAARRAVTRDRHGGQNSKLALGR